MSCINTAKYPALAKWPGYTGRPLPTHLKTEKEFCAFCLEACSKATGSQFRYFLYAAEAIAKADQSSAATYEGIISTALEELALSKPRGDIGAQIRQTLENQNKKPAVDFSSIPDELTKLVLSFLSLQALCIFKTTRKYFRTMPVGNLSLKFTYAYGNQDRFFLLLVSAKKNHCSFSSVIAEQSEEDPVNSIYPGNRFLHLKDKWIELLSQHPIKKLEINDECMMLETNGFQALAKISTLEDLTLDITRKTCGIALKYLPGLNKLRSIKLTKIDKEEIECLAKLDCLSKLYIEMSWFSNEDLRHLKRSNIKHLTFSHSYIIDSDCFEYLKDMPRLEELNIRNCPKMIEEPELTLVAKKMPNLKYFNDIDLSAYRQAAEIPIPLDADEALPLPPQQPQAASLPEATPAPQLIPDAEPSQPPEDPLPDTTAPDNSAALSAPLPPQQPQAASLPEATPAPQLIPNAEPSQPLEAEIAPPLVEQPIQDAEASQPPEDSVLNATAPTENAAPPAEQTQPVDPVVPDNAPDRTTQSGFASIWSGICGCFVWLWACICALFGRSRA